METKILSTRRLAVEKKMRPRACGWGTSPKREVLLFFRKTLNATEVYDLADQVATAAMTGCRMADEKKLMETANGAHEIAFHTIRLRQAENGANKRGDNRNDLYNAAYAAARDLVEYRVANQTGSIRLSNVINSARELYGEKASEEAKIAAHKAFTESVKNERKGITAALAVTENFNAAIAAANIVIAKSQST